MKKTTSMILAVLLAVTSFTACGKESNNPKTDNQTAATIKPAPTMQPAPTVFIPVKPVFITPDPVILEKNATENPRAKYTVYKHRDTPPPFVDRQIIDWSNPDVTTAMKAYKSILKNISPLAETGANGMESIDNCQSSIAFGIHGLLTHFSIIDLDGDQIPEVVLAFGSKISQSQFAILRYCDNTVYAYSLGIRSFNALKIDGTFHSASSGSESYYETISFNGLICIFEYYIELHYDYSYIYDQKTTDKEYIQAIIDKEVNKPDVTWYNYSLENIETYFP